jgi:hypothetical protein
VLVLWKGDQVGACMGVVVTMEGLIEIELSAELDFWARSQLFIRVMEATAGIANQVDAGASQGLSSGAGRLCAAALDHPNPSIDQRGHLAASGELLAGHPRQLAQASPNPAGRWSRVTGKRGGVQVSPDEGIELVWRGAMRWF